MTFLLPLLGLAKSALQWFARLPWYVMTIVALCAMCVILWTLWGRSADGLKVERAKTVTLRQSVDDLMLAVKTQNDAIDALAIEGKKRAQTGKDALTVRAKERVGETATIERITLPAPLSGRCVTPSDVMELGL